MPSNFATLICVGPGDLEASRLQDVLKGLLQVEPECREIVLIDDGMSCSRDQIGEWIDRSCVLTILKNPRNGVGDGWADGLTVGMIAGLRHLSARHDLDFVLRLDTDAAVFGRFSDRVAEFFKAHQGCGLIGTFKKYPDGSKRGKPGFMIDRQVSPYLLLRFLVRLMLETASPRLILTALRRRSLICSAQQNGYVSGDYVQGGGMALSLDFVRSMSRHGLLDDPFLFFHSRVTDDVVITLFCYAVGLEALDFNSPAEVFAVINYGLTDSPEALIRNGYAIAHSVKGDARWPESEIREKFATFRSSMVPSN